MEVVEIIDYVPGDEPGLRYERRVDGAVQEVDWEDFSRENSLLERHPSKWRFFYGHPGQGHRWVAVER